MSWWEWFVEASKVGAYFGIWSALGAWVGLRAKKWKVQKEGDLIGVGSPTYTYTEQVTGSPSRKRIVGYGFLAFVIGYLAFVLAMAASFVLNTVAL
jgi:hypothetical protein